MHKKLIFSLYVVITCLAILDWTLWVAPELKKLPSDFNYSANILSLDNFYDEAVQKFEGQHISKTTFSYHVIAKQPHYLTILNSFNVTTINDKPIFSATRIYYIDPYTGQHIAVSGQEDRSGYLFAPHYAGKKPFYYWHINYDAPALMQFVSKEKINGLTVYHYQAQYEANQTKNLTHLPGVPEKRGVKTNILLQLWIEPISGWLIKYQDNTLAYYYDIKTGERLTPWNSFSNRYTQNSVNQKVIEATCLKWKYLLVDFGVPCLIALFVALFFYREVLKHSVRKLTLPLVILGQQYRTAILSTFALIIFLLAGTGSAYYIFWYREAPTQFVIGISQWNKNIEITAAIQGFKDGLADYGFYEDKNVSYIIKNTNSSIENEIKIIQKFVREKVNIIFTLTTPGTLVAKGITDKIPIVFTDVSYPVEAGIVNTNPTYKSNLVGTLNYISPADQFYPFDVAYPGTKTLGFVHHKGDPDSEIQLQEYKKTLAFRHIEVIDIPAIDFDDMQNELASQLALHHYNALFVACDTLMRDGGGEVAAAFSVKNKIPSFTCDADSVNHGVMVGYYAELYAIGKQAGIKAALILRGAEPYWLRSESPREGYLEINTATAQLLGITIPAEELKKANAEVNH